MGPTSIFNHAFSHQSLLRGLAAKTDKAVDAVADCDKSFFFSILTLVMGVLLGYKKYQEIPALKNSQFHQALLAIHAADIDTEEECIKLKDCEISIYTDDSDTKRVMVKINSTGEKFVLKPDTNERDQPEWLDTESELSLQNIKINAAKILQNSFNHDFKSLPTSLKVAINTDNYKKFIRDQAPGNVPKISLTQLGLFPSYTPGSDTSLIRYEQKNQNLVVTIGSKELTLFNMQKEELQIGIQQDFYNHPELYDSEENNLVAREFELRTVVLTVIENALSIDDTHRFNISYKQENSEKLYPYSQYFFSPFLFSPLHISAFELARLALKTINTKIVNHILRVQLDENLIITYTEQKNPQGVRIEFLNGKNSIKLMLLNMTLEKLQTAFEQHILNNSAKYLKYDHDFNSLDTSLKVALNTDNYKKFIQDQASDNLNTISFIRLGLFTQPIYTNFSGTSLIRHEEKNGHLVVTIGSLFDAQELTLFNMTQEQLRMGIQQDFYNHPDLYGCDENNLIAGQSELKMVLMTTIENTIVIEDAQKFNISYTQENSAKFYPYTQNFLSQFTFSARHMSAIELARIALKTISIQIIDGSVQKAPDLAITNLQPDNHKDDYHVMVEFQTGKISIKLTLLNRKDDFNVIIELQTGEIFIKQTLSNMTLQKLQKAFKQHIVRNVVPYSQIPGVTEQEKEEIKNLSEETAKNTLRSHVLGIVTRAITYGKPYSEVSPTPVHPYGKAILGWRFDDGHFAKLPPEAKKSGISLVPDMNCKVQISGYYMDDHNIAKLSKNKPGLLPVLNSNNRFLNFVENDLAKQQELLPIRKFADDTIVAWRDDGIRLYANEISRGQIISYGISENNRAKLPSCPSGQLPVLNSANQVRRFVTDDLAQKQKLSPVKKINSDSIVAWRDNGIQLVPVKNSAGQIIGYSISTSNLAKLSISDRPAGKYPVLNANNQLIKYCPGAKFAREQGWLPIKDSTGKTVAWRDDKPVKDPGINKAEGAYKKLLFQHPGQSFSDPDISAAYNGVPKHVLLQLKEKPEEGINITPREMIRFIQQRKFTHIILQFPVSDEYLLSSDRGKKDLHKMGILASDYLYDLLHFVPLALEIKECHEHGIILCDIKSENMFFKDKIYLIDTDYMKKQTEANRTTGTIRYLHSQFWGSYDARSPNEPLSGYQKDWYTYFINMASLQQKFNIVNNDEAKAIRDEYGTYQPLTRTQIKHFVRTLPCIKTRQDQVAQFLNNPKSILLSEAWEVLQPVVTS